MTEPEDNYCYHLFYLKNRITFITDLIVFNILWLPRVIFTGATD